MDIRKKILWQNIAKYVDYKEHDISFDIPTLCGILDAMEEYANYKIKEINENTSEHNSIEIEELGYNYNKNLN